MKICSPKILYIFLVLLLASCSEYNKIPYFQDLDHTKVTNSVISNYAPVKIHPGDLLGIDVNGSKESIAPFKEPENLPTSPMFGYRVNAAGEIKMPVIGVVAAADMTTDELKAKLTASIAGYVKDVTVDVRIINFKISVMGDVLKPNEYVVSSEHINILQALTLAGDLNITAKRDNIILIREQDGARHIYPINLNSKKLFDLPYYYLQSNDVIYVEPDQRKSDQVDTKAYRNATLALSALSALGVIISVILVNRK